MSCSSLAGAPAHCSQLQGRNDQQSLEFLTGRDHLSLFVCKYFSLLAKNCLDLTMKPSNYYKANYCLWH
jgi:hypothetical protein